MAGRLVGQVVLITGAESGIGRATALRAAVEGAAIAAIGLDSDGLAGLVAEIQDSGGRAAARVADVADAAAITAGIDDLVAELGGLNVALANAAILRPPRALANLDLDEWDRILAVDLTGVVLTFKAALAHLDNGGVLLAMGSSLAIKPREGRLAYVAAKAGVHAICRSLALELAPQGIRVNVVAPGLTDTPMVHAIPGHVEQGLPAVPLGQLVDPDHVAAMAVHLMTDDARSITGAVVTVDGGRTAG